MSSQRPFWDFDGPSGPAKGRIRDAALFIVSPPNPSDSRHLRITLQLVIEGAELGVDQRQPLEVVTDIELVSHAHAPVKLHGLLANEATVLTPPAFSIYTVPKPFLPRPSDLFFRSAVVSASAFRGRAGRFPHE